MKTTPSTRPKVALADSKDYRYLSHAAPRRTASTNDSPPAGSIIQPRFDLSAVHHYN